MLKTLLRAVQIAVMSGGLAQAGTWVLNGETSRLSFGSIKKDNAGESHSFERLTGTVDAEGNVSIEIDLASVNTFDTDRDALMIEHIFKNTATAELTTEIDLETLKELPVGGTTILDADVDLSFLDTEVNIYVELFVMHVAKGQVMVTPQDILFVSADELDIMPGLDRLMEIAKLPSITRTVPIAARFFFTLDDE